MRWKLVAVFASLAPVLAGCSAIKHATHNVTNEILAGSSQRGIERDLRRDAREAWRVVRAQHPRRAFTDEFHDGFLDGYVDYLDRGGNAQPPATPPIKYVRNRKYFTPEGNCLLRDYYLGFKYGTDCALASGQRQYLTIPILLPDCTPTVSVPQIVAQPGVPYVPYVPTKPPGSDTLPPPRPIPNANSTNGASKFGNNAAITIDREPPRANGTKNTNTVPPLPKPELPIIPPFNPPLPIGEDSKFTPRPVPPDPDLLPPPNPPLAIPSVPLLPVPPESPANPGLPAVPSVPGIPQLTLPPPPDAVPLLPVSVATPPFLDDLPVIPFRFHQSPVTPVGAWILTK